MGSGPELNKDNLEKASRVLDNQIDEEDIEDVAGVFLGSTMGDLFGLEKEDELLAANTPPPQVEYIVNCVMFTMATLCAVRASKHALMFVEQGGLRKLYKIPAMSNLPIDFPTLQSCNTVASLYGALLVSASVSPNSGMHCCASPCLYVECHGRCQGDHRRVVRVQLCGG